LISRRREAKRRALLQMLDRLPIRSNARSIEQSIQQPLGNVSPPADIAVPAGAPHQARQAKQ